MVVMVVVMVVVVLVVVVVMVVAVLVLPLEIFKKIARFGTVTLPLIYLWIEGKGFQLILWTPGDQTSVYFNMY